MQPDKSRDARVAEMSQEELDTMVRTGKIKAGENLLLEAVGGGFVMTGEELAAAGAQPLAGAHVPYPFAKATEMLGMGEASGLSVAAMKRANETARMTEEELVAGLDRVWEAMQSCMNRGLAQGGTLPGGAHGSRSTSVGPCAANAIGPHGESIISAHQPGPVGSSAPSRSPTT